MTSNQSPEIIVQKNSNLLKCMNLYHLGAIHFLSVGIYGGGKRVGAMKKNGFKRGKEKTLGLKEGSLKNPFKFCNDGICNNANRNKSNFSLGKSNTLSHAHFLLFIFPLSLSFFCFPFLFLFLFFFFFFGGGGSSGHKGDLSYTTRAPLPPTTTIKK